MVALKERFGPLEIASGILNSSPVRANRALQPTSLSF